MIARLRALGAGLLRAVLLWVAVVLISVLALVLVLLIGGLIAQPSGTFFNPMYALFLIPASAVLPAYLFFVLVRELVPHLPAVLRRGWLPSLLGIVGVAVLGYVLLMLNPGVPVYIRSVVDMSAAALYALQGLVVSLVVLGEGLAGLWAQKTAQPVTAVSPESVK